MGATNLSSSEFPVDFSNTLRLNTTWKRGGGVSLSMPTVENSRSNKKLTSQHLFEYKAKQNQSAIYSVPSEISLALAT
jgi:hypothetical protein